jgi:hypothetical protein
LEEGMKSPKGALFVVRGKLYSSGAYFNCVFLFSFEITRVYVKGYEGFPLIGDGICSEEVFQLVGEEVGRAFEVGGSGNSEGKLEEVLLGEDGDLARWREDWGILRESEGKYKRKRKKLRENPHSE